MYFITRTVFCRAETRGYCMRMKKTARLIALIVLCILSLSACQESTEAKYSRAQKLLIEEKYFEASSLFDEISTYEDSSKMSMYAKAIAAAENGDYDAAVSSFIALGSFKDSQLMVTYYTGRKYESQADATNWSSWITAAEYYDMVSYFLDSKSHAEFCRKAVYDEAVRLAGNGEFEQSIGMLNALPSYSDSSDLKKYYTAFKLEQEEKISEAAETFKELGDYRNSAEQALQVLQRGYDKADVLEKAGNQEEACAIFASLGDYEDSFERAYKPIYDLGVEKREEKDWYAAIQAFEKAGTYSDAEMQILETRYQQAEYKRTQSNWEEAASLFSGLGEYKDSALQANETYYQQANAMEEKGDQDGAYDLFVSLGRYKDAYDRANKPYYDLGVTKREAKEWDEAVAAFTKIIYYNDAAEQIDLTYYAEGEAKRKAKDWEGARTAFENAGEYADAKEQIAETWYIEGETKREAKDWEGAKEAFASAGEYKDAKEQITATVYKEAIEIEANNPDRAISLLSDISQYADSAERIKMIWYEMGKKKLDLREWEEAVAAFIQAGNYSDAQTQITTTRFHEGETKMAVEDWDGAIEAYKAAGEYGEAAHRIQECLYQKTVNLCELYKKEIVSAQEVADSLNGISDAELYSQARDVLKEGQVFHELWASEFSVGNRILMGYYEQDNNPDNGPEEISWIVLYTGEGKAILLSEKIIDAMPYMIEKHRTELISFIGEEIWRQSDIRSWLNEVFIACFAEQETSLQITNESGDKFFLLDNKEYKQYCSEEDSTAIIATAYALSKDTEHHDLLFYRKDSDGNYVPGVSLIWWIKTGAIKEDGYLYPDDLSMIAGVRPATWISLEKGPTDEWIESHFSSK